MGTKLMKKTYTSHRQFSKMYHQMMLLCKKKSLVLFSPSLPWKIWKKLSALCKTMRSHLLFIFSQMYKRVLIGFFKWHQLEVFVLMMPLSKELVIYHFIYSIAWKSFGCMIIFILNSCLFANFSIFCNFNFAVKAKIFMLRHFNFYFSFNFMWQNFHAI